MTFKYEAPRPLPNLDDCFFYHRMELSEARTAESSWDLRECIDQYLGECDFSGKRSLDIGTASGFLSFEMEKRGAEVVSFDMPSAENWDFVPHHHFDSKWDRKISLHVAAHKKLQNAYWYAHGKLNSRAQVYYGDVYKLPVQLGNFDIVLMGMILGHLRDPFQAIYSASRLCNDTMIITNQVGKKRWWHRFRKKKSGTAFFMPSADDVIYNAWWSLSTECIERMLGTIGFKVERTIESHPTCLVGDRKGRERCISIVANRVCGRAVGTADNSAMNRVA